MTFDFSVFRALHWQWHWNDNDNDNYNDNHNHNDNPHLNFFKGAVLGVKEQGLGIRDKG